MSHHPIARRSAWILCAGTLLLLSACNNKVATNPPAPTPSVASPTPVKSSTPSPRNEDTAKNFAGLKQVVSQTQNAVEAKNFDKAKQKFSDFETYWSKVEDGVKSKSTKNYKAIEDAKDNVTNGLRAKKPNAKEILSDLESLSDILKKLS